MGTDKLVFEGDRGGSDHCACLTRSNVTGRHVTFPLTFFSAYFFFHTFFPYFFSRNFFHVHFSPYFSPRSFSRTCFPPYYFFVVYFPYFFLSFFPVVFSRTIFLLYYFFSVLFQKSRRLKSNVLNYQLVVFLVHVVIAQFIFLAE